RSGDVTSALCVLRRIFRRRQDLAREFLRTADVNEDLTRLPIRFSDVGAVYSERLVRFLRLERVRRERGEVLRHGQALAVPPLPAALPPGQRVTTVVPGY